MISAVSVIEVERPTARASAEDRYPTQSLTGLRFVPVRGGLIPLRGGDDFVPMTKAPYDSRTCCRAARQVSGSLCGDQFADGEDDLGLIDRESALPDSEDGAGRWSVDDLFLDGDAVDPGRGEAKPTPHPSGGRPAADDYAANAVVSGVPETCGISRAQVSGEELNADAELAVVLGPDPDSEGESEQAAANLEARRTGSSSSQATPRELDASSSS